MAIQQLVKLQKNSRIRALEISPSDGKVFLTDYENGNVYYYQGTVPFDAKSPLELVKIFKAPMKGRVIKYWKERNELYIGCAGGKMSVIDIDTYTTGPICKDRFTRLKANIFRFYEIACWRHHPNYFGGERRHHSFCS